MNNYLLHSNLVSIAALSQFSPRTKSLPFSKNKIIGFIHSLSTEQAFEDSYKKQGCKFYVSLPGYVVKDCYPYGVHTLRDKYKGFITIVLSSVAFNLEPYNAEDCRLYSKDTRSDDLLKLLTLYLDGNLCYNVIITVRKGTRNITVPGTEGLVINREFFRKYPNPIIWYLRKILKVFEDDNRRIHRFRNYEVKSIRIIFHPEEDQSKALLTVKKLIYGLDLKTSLASKSNNVPSSPASPTLRNSADIKRCYTELLTSTDVIINKISSILMMYWNSKPLDGLWAKERLWNRQSAKKNKSTQFKKSQIRSFHSSPRHRVNIYNDIKYFLDNNPINMDSQLKIERFLLNHGVNMDEQSNKLILGIYSGLYSKKTIQFLEQYKPGILRKIKNLEKFKESYIEDNDQTKIALVEIIETVPTSYIISVLLGRFIKIVSNTNFNFTLERNLAIDVAMDLSADLIREYLKNKYKRTRADIQKKGSIEDLEALDDLTFSGWLNSNKELSLRFNDQLKLRIGVTLIEWLEDLNILTKKLISHDKVKHNIYIASNDVITSWTDNVIKDDVPVLGLTKTSEKLLEKPHIPLAPFRLPTIVKPKAYIELGNGTVKPGGYHLNDEEYVEGLILKKYGLDQQSLIHKHNNIYEAINYINSVSYKINVDLLNFIRTNPDFYKEVLISNYHPLQNKNKLSKREKIELQKHISKFELQENIFNIAETYKNINDLYFVNRIDNRGRLYCITEYLNYQSTELSKALILFSKPSKIHRVYCENALLYFKAYGANCYGNKMDKVSTMDKVRWVDNNQENILNYDNGILIQEADNKYLFTAFCIEYKKWNYFYYKTDLVCFNSHLPIQVDASCNGFQHLVLLSREVNLRKELNLTPATYDDKPYDFYSYVLEKYKEHLKKLNRSDYQEHEWQSYERIKAFTLDRKIFKKMIMTIPYNAENRTMVNSIAELLKRREHQGETWFSFGGENTHEVSYRDLGVLVRSIKEVLDIQAPRVAKLKEYLRKIALIYTELKLHIPWKLPTGLEVRQSYLESSSIPIRPFTFSTSSIRLTFFKKDLHLDKQTRAFMPNLIHSLDAASLILLLNRYFKDDELAVKNIYTIHDCFAMPMDQVEYVIDALRKSYVELYSSKHYLKQLDESLLNNIHLQYGNSVTFDEKTSRLEVELAGKKCSFEYPNIKEVLGEELPIPSRMTYLAT